MFKTGMVCIKIAGRDAGKRCVVISSEKDGRVLVDGETRRRQANIKHLEPTGETVSLKHDASSADVMKALGLEAKKEKASAGKTAAKSARPKSVPKKKEKKDA